MWAVCSFGNNNALSPCLLLFTVLFSFPIHNYFYFNLCLFLEDTFTGLVRVCFLGTDRFEWKALQHVCACFVRVIFPSPFSSCIARETLWLVESARISHHHPFFNTLALPAIVFRRDWRVGIKTCLVLIGSLSTLAWRNNIEGGDFNSRQSLLFCSGSAILIISSGRNNWLLTP